MIYTSELNLLGHLQSHSLAISCWKMMNYLIFMVEFLAGTIEV